MLKQSELLTHGKHLGNSCHYTTIHLPTMLKVEWELKWDSTTGPRNEALVKLEALVNEKESRERRERSIERTRILVKELWRDVCKREPR